MTDEQKQAIKSANDTIITQKGYKVNNWLPILDTPTIRPLNEVKARMSVMNALINIAFEAPTFIIKEWIEKNQLASHLSPSEAAILAKQNEELTALETNSLQWYLEALWAFMWATKMIDGLEAEAPIANFMALLLPNLEEGESNEKLEAIIELRPETEMYTMLDYYYRLHWYCVDERLNGRQAKLNEGVIYERRKALEWLYNRSSNWDDVEMGT